MRAFSKGTLEKRKCKMRKKQSGFGLIIMLLIAITFIIVLAVSMRDGTNLSLMMGNNNIVQMEVAQASLIRARILQCGTDYPTGNNGTTYNINYPSASTATNVSALICPGNSTNLWAQSDGVTMPAGLSGFGQWQFANDASGMRLTIGASTTNTTNLLSTIAISLGSQASVSSSTLTWTIK